MFNAKNKRICPFHIARQVILEKLRVRQLPQVDQVQSSYAIIAKNSASDRIVTPRAWAFASLLPAFSPQIR